MNLPGHVQRIYLAQHRIDFRKAHTGLLVEARRLGLDPWLGDAVIFVSRDRSRIKTLSADDTGLIMVSKVFVKETMKTAFRFLSEPGIKTITQSEVGLLFEGASFTVHKRPAAWRPTGT